MAQIEKHTKPKMLVVTPHAIDANSFWRCVGPLSYMASQQLVDITVVGAASPVVAWSDVIQYDLVFMHRPCRPDDLTIMKIAYNLNKPVWVDYDDWLFGIPAWNKTAQMYHQQSIQMTMAQCLASADLVSVSTTELFNHYRRVNPNTVIVPNAYRSDLFHYRQTPPDRQNHLVWRGSDTHDGDLLSVKEGLANIKHMVHFMGAPTWMLLSAMKQGTYEMKGANDVMMYFRNIYDSAPKAFIFPLVDCLFNRCKSNIAYIEALHAGAICIAPDLPEWNRQGVVTFKPHDSKDFLHSVDQVMEMSQADVRQVVDEAFISMKETYDISVVTNTREQILKSLLSEPVEKKNPWDQSLALDALAYLKGANRT